MSLVELQKQMSEALAANDVKKIEEVAMLIVKSKSERAQAEAVKAQAEAVALAGDREKLASSILGTVTRSMSSIVADLEAMKANGFTFHRKGVLDANGVAITASSVSLLVPAIKVRKAGGTGGGAGKTKDEFGMSLSEVFEKHATADDRTKLAAAETNSAQWQVKNSVKKRAIKDGLMPPAK